MSVSGRQSAQRMKRMGVSVSESRIQNVYMTGVNSSVESFKSGIYVLPTVSLKLVF